MHTPTPARPFASRLGERLLLGASLVCLTATAAAAQRTAADQSGIHPDVYEYITEDDLKTRKGLLFEAPAAEAGTYAPSPAFIPAVDDALLGYAPYLSSGEPREGSTASEEWRAERARVLQALRQYTPAAPAERKGALTDASVPAATTPR